MIPIGTILSLAGTAASGLMSYFNNRRAKRNQDAEAARQQANYAARASENPLSRSDSQYAINQYDRASKRQLEQGRGIGKILGATQEYGLGIQKAIAEGRANLMGQIASGASERTDKYNELGEQSRQAAAAAEQQRLAARNQTFAALAANAANGIGSIVDAYAGGKIPKVVDDTAINAGTDPNKKKNATGGAVTT